MAFNGLNSIIGTLAPGEATDHCIAVGLPTDMPPGELEVELAFHDTHNELTQSRLVRFDAQPLPRPDFPVRIRQVNDGSGNSRDRGNGRPKRGEWIDIVLNRHRPESGEPYRRTPPRA
jgi:hypothetical protein